jgi:hypothetical protein
MTEISAIYYASTLLTQHLQSKSTVFRKKKYFAPRGLNLYLIVLLFYIYIQTMVLHFVSRNKNTY